ncbi:MAG: efflux RND transporter periplasmic adaptor subunit [Deltaproteobacteria bacterium]|nr:efflux RND transporter periplasmic adaptor subunit [Deltaproteobacteria bacterium]
MTRTKIIWIAAATSVLWLTACNTPGHDSVRDTHREHTTPAADVDHNADVHAEHNAHDDHDNHDAHATDLDRPVADLFADTCEHNINTYTCDECRYEVGVVQVPKRMVDDGLVATASAEPRTITQALRLTGEIQFDERRVTHVSTQVNGIIKKVHVTLGDQVVAGQPLVALESVEVGNARATYQEAIALQRLATQNFERVEALQRDGISSQKELIQAKQEMDAARIRTQAAEGTLSRIGTGSGNGNTSGRLVLKAPTDGNVLTMHAVKGEVAETTDSLITIGDNRALWVWADLFEQDYPQVLSQYTKGPIDAIVYVSAFGTQGFKGVLDYISPAMSEQSRTVKIRIAVQNSESRLLAGMFAEVDLFLGDDQSAKVLSVPAEAVLEDEGTAFVFVHHHGDYYVRRKVTIGRPFGNFVEINSGLTAGSRVVANGSFLLKSDVLRAKMGAGCAH